MSDTLARRGLLEFLPMQAGSRQYEHVRQHYLFSGLAQDEFDGLVAHITTKSFSKGEVLFHRGDKAANFFFVDAGQIELNLIAANGEKKVIEIIGPGRTFAEAVPFMGGFKYPVTAESLEDGCLCVIPNQAYLNLLTENPDACMRLISDLSRHLHAQVREIERLTIQDARTRLSSYLLEHIVEAEDDEATVHLELPRHVIASRLSIQPETLSRLLRTMVDEGILTIDDRVIFVKSLARLRPY